VRMPMKLRVPDNVEKSLTCFSGRTLFSGVSWSYFVDRSQIFFYLLHRKLRCTLFVGSLRVGPVGRIYTKRIKYLLAEQKKFINVTITK
jgi:hypothetical protein